MIESVLQDPDLRRPGRLVPSRAACGAAQPGLGVAV